MAENMADKAVREAEEACQLAIASTPPEYRGFITLIPQNKRVGGTRQNPQFANIRLPYMTVDGRVKQAMDEHRSAGACLTIDTTFEQMGDKTVCRAIVTSTMLGSAIGYAEVKFGGSGVDATNPLENSQTSAVGRALGFLGYGLYGTGIASAEEVLAAMSEQVRQRVDAMTAHSANAVPVPEPEPVEMATTKQLGSIYGSLKYYGVIDGDKRALIEFLYPDGLPKDEATKLIDHMKSQGTLPAHIRQGYIKMLVHRGGHDRQEVAAHMDKTYGHHDPAKLNNAQFTILVEHLAGDDIPEPEENDVYRPETEIKDVTIEEWVEFAKNVCTSCELTATQFEKWAVSQFGNGTITDMTKLPKEAYHALTAMDTDTIKSEVEAFFTTDAEQVTLVS